MRSQLTLFLSGLLFSIGLAVAGMTDANKVIGFLDLSGGTWDPSLGLVMVGAIAVHFVLYRLILKRESPIFRDAFGIPTRRDVNPRLVGGAALFGAGWALGGFCPGPGLTSVATGATEVLLFVGAMAGGMAMFHVVDVMNSDREVRKLEEQHPHRRDVSGNGKRAA